MGQSEGSSVHNYSRKSRLTLKTKFCVQFCRWNTEPSYERIEVFFFFNLSWHGITPCMNFDPSNALRSGQVIFQSNFVALEHSKQIDLSWPLHDSWPQQCITLWSRVFPTKFGGLKVFLSYLTRSGWPRMTLVWPQVPPMCYVTLQWEILLTKFDNHMVFLRQAYWLVDAFWTLMLSLPKVDRSPWASDPYHLVKF